MDKQDLQKIAKKVMDGNATDEERDFIESWYDQFDQKPYQQFDAQQMQDMEGELFQRIIAEKRPSAQIRMMKWVRIAAIWLVVIGIAGFGYMKRTWIMDEVDPVKQMERTASKGHVIQLQLADGTQIWLNGGTTISFPDKFHHDIREIKLSGEAFFKVAHDKSKPFIVYSGNVKTQVLGTSFNIKSYQSLKDIRVSVTQGLVAVSAVSNGKITSSPIMLTPNQQVVFNKATGKLSKNNLDADGINGWVKGNYEFRGSSMAEVALALENRFNVTIVIADPKLAEKRITASFESNDTLKQVLDAFQQTAGLKFRFDDPQKITWY